MAIFPAIEPNDRSYDLSGDFPMMEETSWPFTSIRYRTGSTAATAVGLQLTLSYLDLPLEQKLQIRDHYSFQQGGLIPFILPPIALQGIGILVPAGTQWRYASPPTEQDKRGGRSDVTVQLESMAYQAPSPD